MYGLLFSHTITLSVVEVSCLQHPHIQTDTMKAFVISNARHCTITFVLLLHYLIHFTAANTLLVSGHSLAFTAMAPAESCKIYT